MTCHQSVRIFAFRFGAEYPSEQVHRFYLHFGKNAHGCLLLIEPTKLDVYNIFVTFEVCMRDKMIPLFSPSLKIEI